MYQQPSPPKLTPKQKAIAEAEWPKFTDGEMKRRRRAIETHLASKNFPMYCYTAPADVGLQFLGLRGGL